MIPPLSPFHILITSISAKVPLIDSFRSSFKDVGIPLIIHGGDCNPTCIGRHFVDYFWTMPAIKDLTPKEIVSYCRKHHIEAIIPTRDGDLPFFAKHRDDFDQTGIFTLSSSTAGIHTCLDKLAFHQSCPDVSIPTNKDLQKIPGLHFVAKERFGAGGKNILLNATKEEAKSYASKLKKAIFQPQINGSEYSIDLYLSRKGQLLGAMTRSRDFICNGEAKITTTLRHTQMEQLCSKLASNLQLCGHLVFQAIIDASHKIHIIECNCRLGGASTLSIAAGLNTPIWIYCESRGIEPHNYPFRPNTTPLRQIRHERDLIIKAPKDLR